MNRKFMFSMLFIVLMTPFALRGCAAMMFQVAAAPLAQPAGMQVLALETRNARSVGEALKKIHPEINVQVDERTNSLLIDGASEAVIAKIRALIAYLDAEPAATQPIEVREPSAPFSIEKPWAANQPAAGGAFAEAASPAPAGKATALARARYDETERAVREQTAEGPEIDRAALRKKVAAAFDARQDMLRLELAEFRGRLDRLLRTFEDRERAKDAIVDRRVDELLNPNLRWDGQAPPAEGANKNKPAADLDRVQGSLKALDQKSDDKPSDLGSQASEVRVEFEGPKGAVLVGMDEESLTTPCRLDLAPADIHLFTLKDIPDYPELKLSLALAIWATDSETEAYLRNHAIPIVLASEDLQRAAMGDSIKKAVYLPHNDRSRTEILVSSRLDPSVEIQEEAWQRGHVLLTLKMTPYPMEPALPAAGATDQTSAAGQKPRKLILVGHSDGVTSVAFSPNGKFVASSSRDQTVKIWDAATGLELFTLKRGRGDVKNGHVGYVAAVAFSPDGKQVASAGAGDNTVYLWSVISGRCRRAHVRDSAFMSVAFSPAGRLLAAANYNSVQVWDDSLDDPPGANEILSLNAEMPLSVAFSPDGKRLAAGGRDNKIKIWNSVTGEELLTVQNADQVTCVAFSPDGKRLASACPTGVDIRDATTGKMILMLNGLTGVSRVAYSPDGTRLATAGWDKLARLWDATTGQELLALAGHGNTISGVAFSPDGQRLASSSADRTVRIWDLPPQDEKLRKEPEADKRK